MKETSIFCSVRHLALTLIGCLLAAGCGPVTPLVVDLPKSGWIADLDIDPFTDEITCDVTSSGSIRGSIYTQNLMSFYPLIRFTPKSVLVGVKSGGSVPISTGVIQLRIDSNEAWTIRPEETPYNPDKQFTVSPPAPLVLPNVSSEQQAIFEESMQKTYDVAATMSLGYTLAAGDKAKNIISELEGGSKLIYKAGYLDTSVTGVSGYAMLDGSFANAMALCRAAML